MQSIKIYYSTMTEEEHELIREYIHQYTICFHWVYNRLVEGKMTRNEIAKLAPKKLNHIELLDSCPIGSACLEAEILTKINTHAIFGGRDLFTKRCQNRISSSEELLERRNYMHYYAAGYAARHGNKKFAISEDGRNITFKPSKSKHFELKVSEKTKKPMMKILRTLSYHQKLQDMPISFFLSTDYISICFDETRAFPIEKPLKTTKNRILGLDLNPNYIGWSIVDWKDENEYKVIKHGVYTFKGLNDFENNLILDKLTNRDKKRKRITNKRHFECIEIAKNLINKAKYYGCESVVAEELLLETEDKGRGKKNNRLCNNQWVRSKFVSNVHKRCNLAGITFMELNPAYSSTIGNILYRQNGTPDMVNSSIEMSRRGFEYKRQFLDKSIEIKKNIVYPSLEKFADVISKSLEEAEIAENFMGWKELHSYLQKHGVMYRVPFRGDEEWFEFCSRKSHMGFFEV